MLNENTIYSLQMHETMEGSTFHVGKVLIIVGFIKIWVNKLKNPTIVSLLLVSSLSTILQKIIYMSLYEYFVSHELLIRDNSGCQVE